MHPAIKYGAVAAGAIFFAGWSTGLGGSLVPNLVFSVLMGVFAGLCYLGALWLSGRGRE